jgi:hypothetical protein
VPEISAIPLDLEDGQDWDDILNIPLTRHEAFYALTAMSLMLGNVMDGYEDVKRAAKQGDVVSMLIGPHLADTGKGLQDSMRAVTKVLLPALYAEVQATDAADAAEEPLSK